MIRRIALATVAVTAAALTSGITWSATAGATTPAVSAPPVDQSVDLSVGSVTNMILVPAAGADQPSVALVSGTAGLAGSGGVVAVRLDTQAQTTLPDLANVQKMVIGPDGLLYVSETPNSATNAVSQIQSFDLTTNAVVHTWPTGTVGCPTDLAFAGTDLWFSYTCDGTSLAGNGNGGVGTDGIAHLDTTDGTVVVPDGVTATHSMRLMSIPGAGHANELVIGDNYAAADGGTNNISLVTVSGTTATVTSHIASTGYQQHLSVSPDGNTLTVSSYTDVRNYSTTDLSPLGQTLSVLGIDSVAVSADGRHLAGGTSYTGALTTYDITRGYAPLHNYPGNSSFPPAPDALAWNGDTLLSVYSYQYGSSAQLHILNTALQTPAAMSLRSAASVGRAKALPMTLHLANLDGSPIAGGSILVAKRDAAGAHPIGTFTTGTDGFFHFTDVPAVGGANTYVAVYSGDENHSPVTAVDQVNVLRGTAPLTMKVTSTLYSFHQLGHLTVHLQSHDVKKVQIWVKAGPAAVHYYTTLTVNSHGDAAMNMAMAYNTIFVVKFYGDYYYNARVISTAVGTRALVQIALAGNYGTNGAYALFHPGDDVYHAALVSPNRYGSATCTHFEVFWYVNGSWQPYAQSPCLTYESNGVVYGVLRGGDSGYAMRVRAVFNSDAYNVGNVSPWAYFILR